MKYLKVFDQFVEKITITFLTIAVLGMLGMSVLNIFLRWLDYPINWFDPFIRHLVFLCAFLGGVLATGRGTHIGIDIIGKYLENKGMISAHKNVQRIISLASFLTLAGLVSAGWDYVKVEVEFGKENFLGIHSQYLASIIPIGFGLIAYRFLFVFIDSFSQGEEE